MNRVESEGFGIVNIPIDQKAQYKIQESKKMLARLGVAGACAGNVMLLAAAEYSGADLSEWAGLFSWLGFLFFVPVLVFSSQPFFQNSYRAFKNKSISIDTPIALAIIGGGVLSFLNLLKGRPEVYFDSISMFVFFLLGSRYLIFKIQSKYLSPVSLEDVHSQKDVLKKSGDDYKRVPVTSLKIGDCFQVSKGEYFPLDGELISDHAVVSDTFFSGEFFPKDCEKMDRIYAGSKNLSPETLVRVTRSSSESRLSTIIEKINQSLNTKTHISTLADLGANYLTYAVVISAGFCLAYFATTDLQEGIDRVLALLVVACPCGLAIATPLVQSLAVKRALKKSLLIKNPSALEKVATLSKIVFDKTGTLTSGDVKVISWEPRQPDEIEKALIYSLEKRSEHPVALALLKSVGENPQLNLENFKETFGQGVSANYEGSLYEIKALKDHRQKAVALFRDGEVILKAILGDLLIKDNLKLIEKLHEKSFETFILSGDQESHVKMISKEIGLNESYVFSQQSPEEKALFVEEHRGELIFVGDGVNDSIAMTKSLVSVSVDSSADMAFKSSDVHILSGGASKVLDLIKISSQSLYAIKSILILSFIYNLIFAVLALLGLISPLWAVIIMPLSSLSVTALGFYLMRESNLEV
jgi:Cu2+-exporting ATPase/Cu+-exporting ATPase